MINKQSVISGQQSAVSYLSFPPRILRLRTSRAGKGRGKLQRESNSLTLSLSSSGLTGGLTGQSRTKVLDSPIKSGNDRKKLRRNNGKRSRNDYNFTVFNSSEAGFTLVELLITMVVFLLVMVAASQVFTGLLTQFKQQSKIAETNIEGIIGLEILRQDIEHAGYGLPWVIPAGVSYSEASAGYNDSPSNPPRAILSGNDMTYSSPNNVFNGSDYLIIKAINVAGSGASQKWTHLYQNNTVKEWLPDMERLTTSDRVIVLRTDTRELIVSGTSFTTRYKADTDPDSLFDASFAPPDNVQKRIAYGVTPPASPAVTELLRMPFNRADYYIWRDGTTVANDGVPDRCALGTGILRKAVLNHSGTFQGGILPLLDCVADMQVVYRRDTNGDGSIDNTTDDISALTAQQIRDQVKEVRVYILAHEGQRDVNYTHTPTTIYVGDPSIGGGHNFGIGTNVNYRWKLYTIVVKPNNLR